jgi:hypothetical protein
VTVTPGSWLTRLASGFRYQWRRCNRAGNACKNIRGATRSTYSPTAADGGHTLRGRVTATKGSDVEQLTPQDSDQTSVLLKASVSVHTKVLLSSLLEHGLPFKVKCSSACSGDARLVASGKRKLKSTAHASRAVANLIASPYIDDEAREDLQHLVRTAGFVFAEKRVSLHHSGTVSSRVRVTKKLRGRLKKRHLGKVTLRVTVRTNTGQLRSIVKKVRIVF